MSDDQITQLLNTVERLRIDVLARLNRLEGGQNQPSSSPVAEIMAHIQNIGDVEGTIGSWVGERRSGRWIEGVRISCRVGLPEDLLYRVLLRVNEWSPWSPAGKYCGSMGLALPLRGISFTLRGAAAAVYECGCAATFVDGSECPLVFGHPVMMSRGAPLEAFQIVLRPRTATGGTTFFNAPTDGRV
jgi:hypothetical protein